MEKKTDSILKLSLFVGGLVIACELNSVKLKMFPPMTVKKQVVGKGNASKAEVIEFCNRKYGLELKKKDHDIADGIIMGEMGVKHGGELD